MAGRKRSILFAGVACLALIAVAVARPARAQEALGSEVVTTNPNAETNAIDSQSYDRGRNVSVLQRPRPDYQAIGVHAGGFFIYPKVTVSEAYDSNIFALQNGAVGDFITEITPEIDFQSTWSRDAISGYARLTQDEYARYGSEDATQYGAGLAGKLEFGQSTLTTGVDYAHSVLPRSASNNTGFSVHPIPYDYTALHGQLAHEFTRVRVSLRADDQIYSYSNGETAGGGVVFMRDQNRNVATVTGKAEFAFSPDAAIYFTAAGNTRNYGLNPPTVAYTRNSSGYEVEGGANFDITHLIRGEVQVGYMAQNYTSPLFKPIQGPSAKVQVEWFPTELTTVTVLGSRFVGDSGVINSAGYLGSTVSGQVDHELLRNLILSANVSYTQDQYNGVHRTDNITGLALTANWLITRHLGVTFAYGYTNQASEGVNHGPSFDDNRGSISLVFQY